MITSIIWNIDFISWQFQPWNAIKWPGFTYHFMAFSWLEHFIGFLLGYIHSIMGFHENMTPWNINESQGARLWKYYVLSMKYFIICISQEFHTFVST